jgi:hypothetical protein
VMLLCLHFTSLIYMCVCVYPKMKMEERNDGCFSLDSNSNCVAFEQPICKVRLVCPAVRLVVAPLLRLCSHSLLSVVILV